MLKQKPTWNNFFVVDDRNLFLWLALAGFIVFFLFIGFNNRLAAGDDLYFYDLLQEKGIWTSIQELTFNKRFSSFFLFNATFYFSSEVKDASNFLGVYHLLSLIGLVISSALVIRTLFSEWLFFKIPAKLLWMLAILGVITIFFLVPQLIEIWFWMIGTTVYSAPIIGFLFGIYSVLSKSNGFGIYLLLMLSFLFVGGAVETFAISVLFVLGSILFGTIFLVQSEFWKSRRTKLLFAMGSVLVLLSINFLDGGIESRFILEEKAKVMARNVSSWDDFLRSFLEAKNTVSLVALLVIYSLAKHFKQLGLILPHVNWKKVLFINGLALVVIGAIAIIPIALVFSGWGPHRAWIPFHFFLTISLIAWSFYFGYHSTEHWSNKIKSGYPIALVTLIVIYSMRQFPTVSNYSVQYDLMITEIANEEVKHRSEPLLLPTLPDPGMLVRFTVSSDPESFGNSSLKNAMNLHFDVYAPTKSDKRAEK